ncbi:MAG: hypothetical protein EA350_08200 [Gemmatimonadales bacterium]|nr:MAG: hypothetical protein EA350_08200 [Gemmatimonadales bacterium]
MRAAFPSEAPSTSSWNEARVRGSSSAATPHLRRLRPGSQQAESFRVSPAGRRGWHFRGRTSARAHEREPAGTQERPLQCQSRRTRPWPCCTSRERRHAEEPRTSTPHGPPGAFVRATTVADPWSAGADDVRRFEVNGDNREDVAGVEQEQPGNGAPWLLYGAYGFTGRLLAAEAVRRGHRPILAGRDAGRLREWAEVLEKGFQLPEPLRIRAFALDEGPDIRRGLEGVAAVLNAAGPFGKTARPLMEGCLEARAHYLDITGEVPVFETAFELSDQARDRGLIFMPGVGMDVIPTDAAAALVARVLPDALRLELALHSPGRPSAGTLQTIVEGLPDGLRVRRGGRLVRSSPGRKEFRRWVDLGPEEDNGPMAGKLGGRRSVAPFTWGDLATAWRTTGIPDITCYMTTPRRQARTLPVVLPALQALLSISPVRRLARSLVTRGADGPSPEARARGRCRIWGRAEDAGGRAAEVVLEFPEAYRFTAEGGIRALEQLLKQAAARKEGDPLGAGTLTPAGAFGPEWALELPGVRVVREPGLKD